MISLDDIPTLYIMGMTISGEAANQSDEGQIAVGKVIMRRVIDPRWPNDIKSVCLQKNQFSCWNKGDPNRERIMEEFRHPNAYFLRALENAYYVKSAPDHRFRANHYMTDVLYKTRCPEWAKRMEIYTVINDHIFLVG